MSAIRLRDGADLSKIHVPYVNIMADGRFVVMSDGAAVGTFTTQESALAYSRLLYFGGKS